MVDNKITLDASQLPEGMTAEKLMELLKSAASRAESGEKQRKVRSYAVKKLTDKYADEYKAYKEEAAKKFDAGTL